MVRLGNNRTSGPSAIASLGMSAVTVIKQKNATALDLTSTELTLAKNGTL